MYIPIAYGGGLGKGGIIAVSIDSGSTVTAQLTTGGKIYSAQSANGQAILSGLPVGSYKITATLGDQSTTAQAVIEHEGQVVSLDMSYDLNIYVPGSNWAATTGGYDSNRNTVTYQETPQGYEITNKTGYQGYVRTYIYTVQALDLTDYATMHVKLAVDHTQGAIAQGDHAIQIASAKDTGSAAASISLLSAESLKDQQVDKTIDIRKLSGKYYFRIFAGAGDNVLIKYILQAIYCTK